MSKIHVLSADNEGNYRVAIHAAMVSGDNSAGKSWKSCWLESNKAKNTKQFSADVDIIPVTSSLIVGTDPGNITAAELVDVEAGDVIEILSGIKAESGGASSASLNALVDEVVVDFKARMQAELKYYGHEVT